MNWDEYPLGKSRDSPITQPILPSKHPRSTRDCGQSQDSPNTQQNTKIPQSIASQEYYDNPSIVVIPGVLGTVKNHDSPKCQPIFTPSVGINVVR